LSSINKKYNGSEQACMLSPDSSTIGSTNNSTQIEDCAYTQIQQFSQSGQFGFENVNLSLPIPPPIPPILISQYFPQIHSPPSLNAIALGSSDNTYELNNISLSPNPQALSVAFSPNPQDSYLQTTATLNPSVQDLSLAISPELNQYIFETQTLSQDMLQTPPTTLIDNYITPTDSLGTNYWLPLPQSCFTSVAGHSADNFQPSPDLSPILL
jgi:hypothetical protein